MALLTLRPYDAILWPMETAHTPEPQATEKTVKLSLYLSEDLRKALRIRAIEEWTSATKLVERLIREYLSGGTKEGSEQ